MSEALEVSRRRAIRGRTPAQLIELAVTNGANVDQLGKLMELQLRWEANEARKAWVAAMDAFKAEAPTILKTKHVNQGVNKPQYDHAELDKACDLIIPVLHKNGLQHSWKPDHSNPQHILVTCLITHKMGHFEETTIGGPPDETGGKNRIQAIGSTITYLERYTLLAACGLAAKNQDTDGKAPIVGLDRIGEQCEWIANCRNAEELMRVWKNAHEEAAAVRDYNAVKIYLEAKDKRKDEIFRGSL